MAKAENNPLVPSAKSNAAPGQPAGEAHLRRDERRESGSESSGAGDKLAVGTASFPVLKQLTMTEAEFRFVALGICHALRGGPPMVTDESVSVPLLMKLYALSDPEPGEVEQ